MLESEHGEITFESAGSKIWRANMNGDWKLALDLQKKLPLPQKKQ